MSSTLNQASLRRIGLPGDIRMYELVSSQFKNRYFILSGSGSRQLLASPEVVGYVSYLDLLPSTAAALRYLVEEQGMSPDADILTILRGGLNYPVEEACYQTGIRVRDMHFVSCERIIKDHVITGLEIKYEKLTLTRGRTLVIGDILATGDTFRMCFDHIVERFRRGGGSIRKIIFFTVGGTRAIRLMEEMAPRIRAIFPEFEGFECFFYEGVFTVYEDTGETGVNVPDIDFGWKGGAVCPEFRRYILDRPDALLEKCIIYDGGARRYEIPLHFREVLEYWEAVLQRADRIDLRALVCEKLGYAGPVDYARWLEITHLRELDDPSLIVLWEAEQEMVRRAGDLSLEAIAERRVHAIQTIKQQYE